MSSERPVLRVISGNPGDEEIAVILAIVAGGMAGAHDQVGDLATGQGSTGGDGHWDRWQDPDRLAPQHWSPGSGAWRASTLPR